MIASPGQGRPVVTSADVGLDRSDDHFEQHDRQTFSTALLERFLCADTFSDYTLVGSLSAQPGYFTFGGGLTCFGRCSFCEPGQSADGALPDLSRHSRVSDSIPDLPFHPDELVDNLRHERYKLRRNDLTSTVLQSAAVHNAYYTVRPYLPGYTRKYLQRIALRQSQKVPFPRWPVDMTVERILDKLLALSMVAHQAVEIPFIWFWPDGFSSCALITHDVESEAGLRLCQALMDIDEAHGIKASFQIVPEGRYKASFRSLENIRRRGHEVNIHDLNHDGHLFRSRDEFLQKAVKINRHARQFGANGFRSGMLYRNSAWYDALDIRYDMSIPNVAHLDAQAGGCCTVFPFFIGNIVELPVTTIQDYALFHILGDYSLQTWHAQTEILQKQHGLTQFIVHPDYLKERRAHDVYIALLRYVCALREERGMWIPLPGDLADWWRTRSEMMLQQRGGSLQICGHGSERARIAYARVAGGELVYDICR
jgi:hypothetical protein